MKLFKKYCLMLLMLVMVAQAQQRDLELFRAAKKGDKAAFAQLRALGNKGNADAQNNLGVMYNNGEGVPKDAVQAAFWFRKTISTSFGAAGGFLASEAFISMVAVVIITLIGAWIFGIYTLLLNGSDTGNWAVWMPALLVIHIFAVLYFVTRFVHWAWQAPIPFAR